MDAEFNTLLLAISDELDTPNLASLKFLCIDFISQKEYANIKEAKDLFRHLYERDWLDEENGFLKELLFRIKRMDLLKTKMGTSGEEMKEQLQQKARISPYRLLLFNITEELTEDNVRTVRFMLQSGPSSSYFHLPKSKLENRPMLDIVLEMEKAEFLSKDNVNALKSLVRSIKRNDLLKQIELFQATAKGGPQREGCTDAKPLSGQKIQAKHPSSPSQQRQQQQQGSSASLLDDYKMGEGIVGDCLIFNNYDFSKSQHKFGHEFREGTHLDAEALKKIFKRLRFDVKEHNDLTAQNILDVVKEYGRKVPKEMYCFVCCILSHGDVGAVYGTDGKKVQIKDLTAAVDGQNCSSLAGKPKVFFIQACQGNRGQNYVLVHKDSDEGFQADASPLVSLPIMADFLIGTATVEDYESYRHAKNGSVYIQSICENLETLCKESVDLHTILTKVNSDIAAKVLNRKKQMPEIKSTLCKKLVFPVPMAEADGTEETEDMDLSH